jgi:DNA-binding transcriptional MerR regulator
MLFSVSLNRSTNRPLRSGKLARLAGVSADTLRFYERRGLLPGVARSASGYRIFPQEALARVQLIQSALSIGFSVNDLAGVFRERDRGAAPCRRVRALAAEKLAALEARLCDLQSWRRELRKTLAEWDHMLAKTPRGKQARLLETFAATHRNSRARKLNFNLQVHRIRKRETQQ